MAKEIQTQVNIIKKKFDFNIQNDNFHAIQNSIINFQLNEVYSKADRLKKWYKKITIDSFYQGSVLVDYVVELSDVSRDIDTQEIKQMFHNALTEVPMTVVPLKNNATASSNMEQIISDMPENTKPARSNYLMGNFILDPLATDFVGKIEWSLFVSFFLFSLYNSIVFPNKNQRILFSYFYFSYTKATRSTNTTE